MDEAAHALQRLLWAASGHAAPAQSISPRQLLEENRLAPYADLLTSAEPLLTWPHFDDSDLSTSTSDCSELRMPAALWVVMLEEKEEEGVPVLLRHVVLPLLQCQCRVEASRAGCSTGRLLTATPLHWVLFLRCQLTSACRPLMDLLSLVRLLEMGADPNAPLRWTHESVQVGGAGLSPLHGVLRSCVSDGPCMWETLQTLLAYGARLDPIADRGALTEAMRDRGVERVLQLFRAFPDALQGVQHTATRDDSAGWGRRTTPLHVLAMERPTPSPGAVADARFLHETLGVSLLTRDTLDFTAEERAVRRQIHHPSPEWPDLIAYLQRAEAAERLELQRRMSVAAHHALSRLTPELRGLVGNEFLPRDRFARFGRKPPSSI